jgi:DGQHR domain-containing protein
MAQKTLKLQVIKDTCLGHEVFRGSAAAGELFGASWIDFHDPDANPEGYQRPFDRRLSERAAEYAESVPDAFWPECVLAIRDNAEVEDDEEKVNWAFTPMPGSKQRYGILEVTYNADGRTLINGNEEPWRRAFAQVDCQHRLGSMAGSNKLVTFCIFPRLFRREEAIVFRTINARQKKISTSLVDAIILLTDPNRPPHVKWAWDLGLDPGIPFNKRVWTGGRGRSPASHLITLAGLRQALEILAPRSLLNGQDPDLWYPWVRGFWKVVKSLWPEEFGDRTRYKLQTVPGQRGLAQFGQHIFREVLPSQDYRQKTVRAAFGDPSKIDWRVKGPFELATGKGGQRDVYRALLNAYGLPR